MENRRRERAQERKREKGRKSEKRVRNFLITVGNSITVGFSDLSSTDKKSTLPQTPHRLHRAFAERVVFRKHRSAAPRLGGRKYKINVCLSNPSLIHARLTRDGPPREVVETWSSSLARPSTAFR